MTHRLIHADLVIVAAATTPRGWEVVGRDRRWRRIGTYFKLQGTSGELGGDIVEVLGSKLPVLYSKRSRPPDYRIQADRGELIDKVLRPELKSHRVNFDFSSRSQIELFWFPLLFGNGIRLEGQLFSMGIGHD